MSKCILIEPFYGGSHKQLMDLLADKFNIPHLYTMNAKKWHWRARTSALYFSQMIPENPDIKVLFCSATLNLAELIALRSDLKDLYKIVYFHENQLTYPVRQAQTRDFQYGYNQVLTCLAADLICFNSAYNKDSFLNNLDSFFNTMPDYKPKGLRDKIEPKCQVLYFPLLIEPMPRCLSYKDSVLHIVWPHRWEHDKNPEQFFSVLLRLKEEDIPFNVSVIGETYNEMPEIFISAKENLGDRVKHWGYQASKHDYLNVLSQSDVVVSTSIHEFYGVAMLEAVTLGCYPLCPNRLVYPEIFPEEHLYNTTQQLYKKLKRFCKHPEVVANAHVNVDLDKFHWRKLGSDWRNVLKLESI